MSDKKTSFFKLLLKNVPSPAEDVLTFFCFENGAQGVSENLKFSQPDLTYDPTILKSEFIDLDVYFEAAPDAGFIDQLRAQWPAISIDLSQHENKDWLAEWKKHFRPFSLVDKYWVVPSWLPKPEEAEIALRIDPGMAFGTGTHATTQLASELLIKVARGQSGFWELLDVGTGTAILAMLAKLEGASSVVGIDNDPEARRVARENLNFNNFEDISVPDTQLPDMKKNFDVVVANIIDGVLVQLRDDLLNCLKPGGILILSGILLEREAKFTEGFFRTLPKDVVRIAKEEWVAFAYAPILG